jgi:alanine dehydrogenase
LTNATLPYALKIADLGYKKAFAQSLPLRKGLNVYLGKLTNKAVSDAVGIEYSAYDSLF